MGWRRKAKSESALARIWLDTIRSLAIRLANKSHLGKSTLVPGHLRVFASPVRLFVFARDDGPTTLRKVKQTRPLRGSGGFLSAILPRVDAFMKILLNSRLSNREAREKR